MATNPKYQALCVFYDLFRFNQVDEFVTLWYALSSAQEKQLRQFISETQADHMRIGSTFFTHTVYSQEQISVEQIQELLKALTRQDLSMSEHMKHNVNRSK